jgi:anaerobic magnesium-protoporphyrin IX monomethyl ester cyclase
MKPVAVLINPPHAGSYRSAVMLGDSLALASLAGVCRDHAFETCVLDGFLHSWSVAEIISRLPQRIDLALITNMHQHAWASTQQLLGVIRQKNPRSFTMLGGAAPTLNPRFYTDRAIDLDAVYTGAAMGKLTQLLAGWDDRRGPCKSGARAPVVIDGALSEGAGTPAILCRPDLHDSFEADAIVCLESSKGCYASCGFCSIASHYRRRWFVKALDQVFAEVDFIRQQLPHCTELRFVDANFFGADLPESTTHALSIADDLQRRGFRFRVECRANDVRPDLFRKLRAAGLVGVFIGFESGVDSFLRQVRKEVTVKRSLAAVETLKSLEISCSFGFMMISTTAGVTELRSNYEFLKALGQGIRLKHLFSGLIHQVGTEFDEREILEEAADTSLESRLGYMPADPACQMLVRFWDSLQQQRPDLLQQEHIIGVTLERGREARLPEFWAVDREFSAACLEAFRSFLDDVVDPAFGAQTLDRVKAVHIAHLEDILVGTSKKLAQLALPSRVMLDSLRGHVSES